MFTATTIEITEESLARCSQLEEPTGILRLGARFTKVEQAVFLPEVNKITITSRAYLVQIRFNRLTELTDSRRLVGDHAEDLRLVRCRRCYLPPGSGCSPQLIRPIDGFCFQKRQVTMQERRLKLEEMYQVSSCGPPQEVKACVFPTKDVRRVRKNNSVLAPSSGYYKRSYCI